jgi:hypothetical protein
MSIAAIVVLTVVITLAAASAGILVVKARQSGAELPWDKIRPILTEVFTEVIKIREADAMGYGKLEDYAVKFVKSKIDAAEFLTQGEKELMTESMIRSFIGPRLEELYNQKG